MLLRKTQLLQTARSEIRRVQLEDGSVAAINSETALEVVMSPRLRHVRLLRGDAWFQVAKDASRPFVVQTDRMQVRAVGTAFAVAAADKASTVLVSEGVVEVEGVGRRVRPRRLAAGSHGSLADGGEIETAVVPLDAIGRALAWREAQIALDGDTLAEAVEKFNRYNLRKLVIEEPELADRKLVGWFWMNDPESFARAAAVSLGAKVSLEPDRIVLARRDGGAG
jgi:transmembrane sensor